LGETVTRCDFFEGNTALRNFDGAIWSICVSILEITFFGPCSIELRDRQIAEQRKTRRRSMGDLRKKLHTTAERMRLSGVRRTGVVGMIGLSVYLLCGAQSSPQACQQQRIGPSGGQVAAGVAIVAAVVVGTVVLVEVHKNHHRVKGCVFDGPSGIELRTGGDTPKVYSLAGDASKITVGDMVRLHGNKVKKTKDSAGDQTFTVEKITKDYGPCKLPDPAAKTAA
jgi:hypothetical protein